MTSIAKHCASRWIFLACLASQTGAGAGHQWQGKPAAIRCDNGPEYISEELKQWAQQKRIALRYIQPGNPQQNAYIERFNRTVRYDWLGHYLFESLNELQEFA
ncbi:integrase core domain-containing protein [Klebsiella pneumoniae subsp. pneumoniae]